MRLQELEAHIPDQTLKINRLINIPTRFADFVEEEEEENPSWATFRNSVWGNTSASAPSDASEGQGGLEVQQEIGMEVDVSATGDGEPSGDAPSTHPFVKLPETLPNVWSFDSSHILVRPEYEEAEKAALAAIARNANAFLVIGQSGIGKSLFLVWLLIRRLALKLPTALQIRSNKALLFHGGGVSLFRDLLDNGAYLGLNFKKNPSSRIWVLVDSSPNLPEPTPVFRAGDPFFVVEAASREHEWCKKVFSKYFYMKTWALSEVLQARPLLGLSWGGPHDESNIRYLYNEYGASPRALAMYASDPQEFKDRVVAQVLRTTPDSLLHALKNPESDSSSDLITRMEPSASRRLPTKTIASPGAFKLLWDQHLKNRVTDMEYYYDIFQQGSPVTVTAAGWIFEFRMRQLLAQNYLLNLFPLRNPTKGRVFDIYSDYSDSRKKRKFRLTASSECPLDEGIKLEVGRYYRPEAKNFPTIDALRLIQPKDSLPILLMFQITRNQSGHDVGEAGLDMIAMLKLPVNTQTYYVAITPHNIEPAIRVPKGRFKDVHVFHHPVPQSTLFPCRSL